MKPQNKFLVRISFLWIFYLLFFTSRVPAQEKTLEEMTIKELMDVQVITASKRIQTVIEAPATIYVITEDDIKQYGYRDLKDILQNLPGIEYAYPQSHIHGGQRGFSGNWSQTKLLINGRQVNMLFSGEVYVASQYPLYNVKQIEIIQGPASALYGADAYTGVINIITKNCENVENGSCLFLSLGSIDKLFDNKEVGFNVIAEKKKFGMTLSGTIFNQKGPDFTDFLRSAEYTEYNRQLRNEMFDSGNPYRDDNRAYNTNVDLIYSVNDNSKIAAGIHFLGNKDGGGFENPEIVYTNFEMIVEQTLTYLTYENNFTSFPVKLLVDVFRGDENVFIRHQNMVDEGDNPPYLGAINAEGSKLHRINAQFDITPKSIPNYLIAGFGYQETNISEIAHTGLSRFDSTMGKPIVGRYLFPPKGYFAFLRPYLDQNKVYAYLQDQHSFFKDKLQITLGGRYDHHNIYGNIVNLRSGLYFQLKKGLVLKMLYGEAFREPTIFELSMNPNLKPAEMKTSELSLHVDPIKNIAGQIVYYFNNASKLIIEQRGTTGIGSMWDNAGSKKTQGLESLLKWQYNKLRGNLWYNYERNPDDPNFLNVAKNKFGAGVIYNITRSISMSLQGNYIGKIKTNAWDADRNDIVITIPEYKSFNLTILAGQIEFSDFPKFDISFSIYNLFNTKNLYPNMRGPNPSRYLAEGRSFYLKAGIHF
jgi:outer membrane receptor for ferrienterochelin and colicin